MTVTTRSLSSLAVWAAAGEGERSVKAEGDRALLELASGGDEKACRELIDRHGARLLQIVRAAHGDLGLAEDVVQETFIRALAQAKQLREEASMVPWLVRIALRVAIDYRRKVRRETLTDAALEVPADRESSPDHTLAEAEDSRRLHGALAELKPYARELMVLRYFASFSVAELAQVFGKSEPAIRKDLQRARDRVRVLLGDWFAGGRSER